MSLKPWIFPTLVFLAIGGLAAAGDYIFDVLPTVLSYGLSLILRVLEIAILALLIFAFLCWVCLTSERRLAAWKVVRILLPLIVCGVVIGYELGQRASPSYTKPHVLQMFVARHATLYDRGRSLSEPSRIGDADVHFDGSGRPAKIIPKGRVMTFDCAFRYTYHPSGKVDKGALPDAVPVVRDPPLTPIEVGLLVYGGAESLKLGTRIPEFISQVEGLAARTRITMYIGGAVAVLSGVWLGARLGYEDALKCDSNAYDSLLYDRAFWEGVDMESRKNHTLQITYDEQGLPHLSNTRDAEVMAHDWMALFRTVDDVVASRWDVYTLPREYSELGRAIRDVREGHLPQMLILENQLEPRNHTLALAYEKILYEWSHAVAPSAARILCGTRSPDDVMVIVYYAEL